MATGRCAVNATLSTPCSEPGYCAGHCNSMRYLLIIAAAALVGCAEAEQVTEVPEGEVDVTLASPSGPQAGNGNGTDQARPAVGEPAPGQWFSRAGAEDRWAGYGPPNSEASFSVRCEGEQLVFSTIEMPRSGPGPTDINISAAGFNETLAAEASEEGLPNTEATVAANSPWLARLASASGDLTVRVGGGSPLIVPIAEPLTSLIRDCGR